MKRVISVVLAVLVVCSFGVGFAQETFPSRPITLIVPWAAGGGTDAVARGLATPVSEILGVPVNVTNIVGGSGAIGLAEAMNAKPDGYTLVILPVELAFMDKIGVYPFSLDNFETIMLLNSDPAALTVNAKASWNTVEEFVEYGRQNPGALKIGHSGVGLLWHLAAVALEDKAGVEFNLIPYDGAAPAIKALLGGEIDAVTVSAPEVSSQVLGGELKCLAIMDEERYFLFPETPTMKEAGYDIVINTFRGLGGPKGIPQDRREIIHDAFKKAMEDEEFVRLMQNLGYGVKYLGPEDYRKFFYDTEAQLTELLKIAGLLKEQ